MCAAIARSENCPARADARLKPDLLSEAARPRVIAQKARRRFSFAVIPSAAEGSAVALSKGQDGAAPRQVRLGNARRAEMHGERARATSVELD
jgi:hypothetical protein